jgi:hypothetical protein
MLNVYIIASVGILQKKLLLIILGSLETKLLVNSAYLFTHRELQRDLVGDGLMKQI